VAHVRTDFVLLRSVRRLLVTASVVPSSPILVTLMKEALSSCEMLVLTRATWRNIPEDAILPENYASINSSIYGCVFVAAVTVSPSRCLEALWIDT
jgi:hypothetical protein